MEIFVAQSAGFCFGVQRAIEKAKGSINDEGKVYTYGPIIHNKHVVGELEVMGIGIVNEINDVNIGDRIIIRSHGISRKEFEAMEEKNAEIVDATCPYVKHIHKIAEERYNAGYKIIIIGDSNHPEVKGVNGWCNNEGIIINDEADIINSSLKFDKICIVSQTTFNQEKWYILVGKLIKCAKEVLIYNTICSATQVRQDEANELSKKVDAMIIIGGKESSNSKKLYEICNANCSNTIFIEGEDELNIDDLKSYNKIGITAGASTPDYTINNVINKIRDLSNQENTNMELEENEKMSENKEMNGYTEEEQQYFMSFKRIYPGDIIEGRIITVTDSEIFVDLGYKSDGVLPASEISGVNVNLKEKFKAGDIVKAEVLSMNDGEGNVLLSRRAVEKDEVFKEIYKYKEEGREIDILIKASVKGGFSCQYGDIRAFMPGSLSGIGNDDVASYIGKRVKALIADVKERKREIEIIVSRKEIVRKEREVKKKELFEKMEEGQIYSGIVKSMINSGAFINIGDVDVFLPISELSWKRIHKPQDVLSEGQRVEILIIKVDRDEMKASGSLKRMKKEPFEEFIEKYNVGENIEGKVVRFADFGAFVELIDGVDGLIHISQIADRRINKPQEVLKIGQIVKAKIINIDIEGKKVSLSLKEEE